MKKMMLMLGAALVVATIAGCGSLRTPDGAYNKKVYYCTFFGLSIESAVYGDGFIVKPAAK